MKRIAEEEAMRSAKEELEIEAMKAKLKEKQRASEVNKAIAS